MLSVGFLELGAGKTLVISKDLGSARTMQMNGVSGIVLFSSYLLL